MTGAQPGWTPEFPGQRPPFQVNNQLSVKHGAYSPSRVDPLADALVSERLADQQTAYLQQPAYRPALYGWARAEARVILLDEWMQRHLADTGGCVRCKACSAVADQLLRFEASAANHRARLGLDPLSRARLGRDVAAASVDLASLLSDARAAQERDGDVR